MKLTMAPSGGFAVSLKEIQVFIPVASRCRGLLCVAAFPAEAYENDSGHAGESGESFLPVHGVHPDADAYCGGHDGLAVVVHADEGRTYVLLADGKQKIGDERGSEHKHGEICSEMSVELTPVEVGEFSCREGEGGE